MSWWPLGKGKSDTNSGSPKKSPKQNQEELRQIVTEDGQWKRRFANGYESKLRLQGFTADEIEDLLQNIRVSAWQSQANYRGESSAVYFLYQVAKNHRSDVIDHNVKERKHTISWSHLQQSNPDNQRPIEELLTDSNAPSVSDLALASAMLAIWEPARDEVNRRALELSNEHYKKILAALTDPQQRDDAEKDMYQTLAFITGLKKTLVPVNVSRAKAKGAEIAQQVAFEGDLDEAFVQWVVNQWELR